MPQNEAMSTTPGRALRLTLSIGATLLLIAACGSSVGPGWTYAPPVSPSPGAGAAASASAAATASASTSASPSPPASASQSATASSSGGTGTGTEIDLTETADLRIVDAAGQPVSNINVTKGTAYTFKITNTAGFDHDFYIGNPSDLQAGNTASLTGVSAFSSGTKTFTYTFSGATPIGFGCTIPGHYQTMHGSFTVQP